MKKLLISTSILLLSILFFSCKKEVIVDQTGTTTASTTDVNTDVAEDVNTPNNSTIQNDLPANALAFLNTNFSNIGIASYEIKNIPVVGKSYEVKLNNGVEIDFDEAGNWHELKDPRGVQQSLIPTAIHTYVEQNYKGTFVTSIDKEKDMIKVELANDVDLEFDLNGKFLRID